MNPEVSISPDERRRNALMDGSGFTPDAAAILRGEKVVGATSELPQSPTLRRSHVSRRGGRSYPEPSGRDASRELANKDALENPQTPEEWAAIQSGPGHAAYLESRAAMAAAAQRTVAERTR
jgi:hypothetical protein